VSYLPFAWIGEQMMSISCGMQIGYTLIPRGAGNRPANIREIGPHVMFAPPRHVRTDDPQCRSSTWTQLAEAHVFQVRHLGRLPLR